MTAPFVDISTKAMLLPRSAPSVRLLPLSSLN